MQQQLMNFMRWGKWEAGKSPGRNGWYCKHPSELVWKCGPQSWVQPWGKTQIQYLHTLSAWIFRPHLSLRAQIHHYHHPKNKPNKNAKNATQRKKGKQWREQHPLQWPKSFRKNQISKTHALKLQNSQISGKKNSTKKSERKKEGKKRLLSTYLEDDSLGP
jgi:hypothetical protein